jgi:membrane protease YdiL (CAAX protease family)
LADKPAGALTEAEAAAELARLAAAIVHALGGTVVTPPSRGTLPRVVASGAVTFLYSLFFTGILEEPGWRGFLLPRLEQRFSPLLASVLVWAPWALWHAPLDFSGSVGHSWISYLQIRVVFFLPITIIFTWLYNRSQGNILSTAIFHAGMNTFPFVLPYAPKMLGLILLWAVYVVVAERMWRPLHS